MPRLMVEKLSGAGGRNVKLLTVGLVPLLLMLMSVTAAAQDPGTAWSVDSYASTPLIPAFQPLYVNAGSTDQTYRVTNNGPEPVKVKLDNDTVATLQPEGSVDVTVPPGKTLAVRITTTGAATGTYEPVP